MDMSLKRTFVDQWKKYFAAAELPIVFYYADGEARGSRVEAKPSNRCLVGNLDRVRRGEVLVFGADSIGCPGGRRYAGFSQALQPGFEHFLSCGIPGKMEGERYKKTPELVREVLTRSPVFKAPARFIVFKRWDLVEENESPDAVVFFATPDVLAGLFTLASFDSAGPSGVIAPFSAGCGSIVEYPYLEKTSKAPRCVIGLFDPSARPFVEPDRVSFAAPWERFVAMVGNMEESFLTTPTWARIRERIARPA
ncbi:MAG TPA: DUF169 domain-containing protein [Burkholderiales bacterium]|nr:DUF169 domain-containing protein [Burkholderiales bacterium]